MAYFRYCIKFKLCILIPDFEDFHCFVMNRFSQSIFLLNYCTEQCTVQGEYLWVLIYVYSPLSRDGLFCSVVITFLLPPKGVQLYGYLMGLQQNWQQIFIDKTIKLKQIFFSLRDEKLIIIGFLTIIVLGGGGGKLSVSSPYNNSALLKEMSLLPQS